MSPRVLVGAAVVVAGLLLNSRLAGLARPELSAPVGMTKEQQDKLEEVATSSLFGQFRTNIADFLWLKVDKYLHSGVDLRAMTEDEKRSANGPHVSTAENDPVGNWKHTDDETTVVLSKERDWRGVLGDVEREVKPYMDMRNHQHHDPKEALPLFRLMTWSNPKFVQGYAVGAAMIAREEKAFDQALMFIAEGERNNPESVEIQATYSWLLMHGAFYNGRNDYPQAVAQAEKGVAAVKQRDPSTLTQDEREAWQECVRWRVIGYREMGRWDQAAEAARDGLKTFPEDGTCKKLLGEYAALKAKNPGAKPPVTGPRNP